MRFSVALNGKPSERSASWDPPVAEQPASEVLGRRCAGSITLMRRLKKPAWFQPKLSSW